MYLFGLGSEKTPNPGLYKIKVTVLSHKRKLEIGNPGLVWQHDNCIRQPNADSYVLPPRDVVSFVRSPQDPKWMEELLTSWLSCRKKIGIRENNGLLLAVATPVDQFFSSSTKHIYQYPLTGILP